MTDLNPPKTVRATPHPIGWFFDLFSYFGRAGHPVSAEMSFDDMEGLDAPGPDGSLEDFLKLHADRQKRVQLFEEMDSFGLVESILDLYAEESTQPDYDKQRRVWIESKARHMVSQGDRCLRNCQVEERVVPIARRMAKYGDEFRRLIYEAGKGVLGWRTAKTMNVRRIEDRYSRLIGFKEETKKYRAGKRDVSWPWDYVHFRLLGKDEDDLYGTSLLQAMFRPWRQLALTEDAMLMYRLRRMPDRNAFFIGMGNMEVPEAMKWLNTFRKKFRKHEFVDPASPAYKKQYNPMTPLEDVFLPVREGDDVRIETLPGGGNIGEIYDLEYYRDAFFGTARVPKAYLGFEGDINAKATLIQQDVRFARTVKRLRSATIQGLRNLLDIHFMLSNTPGSDEKFDPTRSENAYIVQMSPVSYLDEFERLELIQLRFQIVETMSRLASDMQLDARVWATYILLTYAKLDEELVLKLISKTPDAVSEAKFVAGMSPDQFRRWQALSEDQRAQVLDLKGEQRKGYYELSEAEQVEIAKAIHDSPGLRKVIGDLASFFADGDLHEQSKQQVDSSLIPPTLPDGQPLTSEQESDKDAKQLHEDLQSLKNTPESPDTAESQPTLTEET